MTETVIEAVGLRKSFGSEVVLDGVSITARRGEAVGVVGPNGCGKTTLLRILAGVERADGGSVAVSGRVGYVPQDPLLLPWKTLRANIALGLVFRGAPRGVIESKVTEAARLLGIEEHLGKYPRQVSGGTARKASIARALVLDPDVLLLDEPFTGLDVSSVEVLSASLKLLKRKGYTMVIVSHQIDELVEVADVIYVLTHRPARVKAVVSLRGLAPMERLARLYEALGAHRSRVA